MSAMFPTYNRFPVCIQSAEGATITDTFGKTYIDAGAGIGVCNLGHRNPKVHDGILQQMNQYVHTSNLYQQPIQEEVAEHLIGKMFGDYVFFANSGAEANEAAIKLARSATGKSHIITCEKSFHGRTFASMSATGQQGVQEGFGPLLPSFSYAEFNNFDAIEKLVTKDTAAIMLELIQGEGGVHVADHTFIKQVKELCDTKNILLIIDEIQTGMGRTGTLFAYEQYEIEPDIVTLAKGLGNGFPIGAMIGKATLKNAFGPGKHGSTFGGNPVALAAAQAVLHEMTPTFLQEVQEKSIILREKLMEALEPFDEVIEIRGLGMMIGIEVSSDVSTIIQTSIDYGLLVLSAGKNVIRLLPPLTITYEEMDLIVHRLQKSLQQEDI